MAEETSNILARQIQTAIDGTVTDLWPIATALAAVGILAFATLELIKAFPVVRNWINSRLFRIRLKKNLRESNSVPRAEIAHEVDAEIAEIAKLATGGDAWILFGLPAERMTGQINAAVQTALTYPEKYKKIIVALAHNADIADVVIVTSGLPKPANPIEPTSEERSAIEAFSNARTRVTAVIQRNLDVIQIYVADRWALINQISAVLVSTVIISIVAFPSMTIFKPQIPVVGDIIQLGKWALFSLIGGMVAPVAKDIVASLKTLRTRDR